MPFAGGVNRHERVNTRIRPLHDVVTKSRHRHVARTTQVNHGGDPGVHPNQLGIETKPADRVLENMGVRIDEPRQHQPVPHIDSFFRFIG